MYHKIIITVLITDPNNIRAMYNCIKTELLLLREKTENQPTFFSKVEVDFLRRQVGRENSSIGQLEVVLSVIVVISYSLKSKW